MEMVKETAVEMIFEFEIDELNPGPAEVVELAGE